MAEEALSAHQLRSVGEILHSINELGEEELAERVLVAAAATAEHLRARSHNDSLTYLVSLAVQRDFVSRLGPEVLYGATGQTVGEVAAAAERDYKRLLETNSLEPQTFSPAEADLFYDAPSPKASSPRSWRFGSGVRPWEGKTLAARLPTLPRPARE